MRTELIPPALLLLLAGAAPLAAQPNPMTPDPRMARPIDALDTVFLEEMTWLEVRDALAAGKRTAILASGGIEQNGPYLATGKHNYILRATTEAIARKLGDALVAPIVGFVPEGGFDPPTEHMKYPGSISVRPETFEALLTDIVTSLKIHGFDHIMLIADSGGNVAGMQAVAERLNRQWNGRPAVRYVPEYYNYPDVAKWLETQGIRQTPEGHHDDYAITSQMMVVDPNTVRMRQREAKGNFRINGVALAPAERTIAMGRRVIEFRAEAAAAAIRRARGK